MHPENKNARPGDAEASGPSEHRSSIPTAAQLQGQCDPHLQITKLFMQLTEAECRDFLADLRHRHPDLWASVAGTESEVAK